MPSSSLGTLAARVVPARPEQSGKRMFAVLTAVAIDLTAGWPDCSGRVDQR
jgi:hypothetical protein